MGLRSTSRRVKIVCVAVECWFKTSFECTVPLRLAAWKWRLKDQPARLWSSVKKMRCIRKAWANVFGNVRCFQFVILPLVIGNWSLQQWSRFCTITTTNLWVGKPRAYKLYDWLSHTKDPKLFFVLAFKIVDQIWCLRVKRLVGEYCIHSVREHDMSMICHTCTRTLNNDTCRDSKIQTDVLFPILNTWIRIIPW